MGRTKHVNPGTSMRHPKYWVISVCYCSAHGFYHGFYSPPDDDTGRAVTIEAAKEESGGPSGPGFYAVDERIMRVSKILEDMADA